MMNFLNSDISRRRFLFVLMLTIFSSGFFATPSLAMETKSIENIVVVSEEQLKNKIEEVSSSTYLTQQEINTLIELYRKSLSEMSLSEDYKQKYAFYKEVTKTYPKQTEDILNSIERRKKNLKKGAKPKLFNSSLRQAEQQINKLKADFASVRAKLTENQNKLAFETNRPEQARRELLNARKNKDALSGNFNIAENDSTKSADLLEAEKWLKQVTSQRIQNEILAIDEELLSHDIRRKFIVANIELTQLDLDYVNNKITQLDGFLSDRRLTDIQQAIDENHAAKQLTDNQEPIIQNIIELNDLLIEQLSLSAEQLQYYSSTDTQKEQENDKLRKEFQSTVKKLSTESINQRTGQMLLARKRNLPDIRELDSEIRFNKKLQSKQSILRSQHQEEFTQLSEVNESNFLESTTDIITQKTSNISEYAPEIQAQYLALIEARKLLLTQAIVLDNTFITGLDEVANANSYLRETLLQYHALLNEKLVWMRSSESFSISSITSIPDQLEALFSPLFQPELIETIFLHKTYLVSIVLALCLLLFYWVKKKAILTSLAETSLTIKKVSKDSYSNTLKALMITIMMTLPWIILCLVFAYTFLTIPSNNDATYVLGEALLEFSEYLFYFLLVYNAFQNKGLCEAHFRWEKARTEQGMSRLVKFAWAFFPFHFLFLLISKAPSTEYDNSIGLLSIIVISVSVSAYLKNRIVFSYMVDEKRTSQLSTYFIKLVLVTTPLTLIGLSLFGYLYGAITVVKLLIDSVFFLIPIKLIYEMLKRLIWMSQRKLTLKLEIEKLEAARKIKQEGQLDEISEAIEEPEIDVDSISTETRELLNIFIIIIMFFGLVLIWAPLLPALSILDTVSLWQHSTLVDGAEVILPITLSDVLFAVFVTTLSFVTLKKMPSLLEMTIFQYLEVEAGTRYASLTLTKYAITVITVVWLTRTLGFEWAQMQWLVAAMGVGIGFGLQEIIANFISGLIILFERPIRIGDVVSIGDTDGIVTKIEIRATTIRRWDRKELLVPNKEFITGRLLNWTLSDSINRHIVTIGIAYGSDVKKAMAIIKDICDKDENTLAEPEPTIAFEEFGDNALTITARVYFNSVDKILMLKTTLNTKCYDALNEAGIGIAFPQRDVHLDTSSPLEVKFLNSPTKSTP